VRRRRLTPTDKNQELRRAVQEAQPANQDWPVLKAAELTGADAVVETVPLFVMTAADTTGWFWVGVGAI